MDSFMKWIGGKKLLRKDIVNRFPEKMEKYVEVFGGAAWVLFYKEQHAVKEVYNDINSELVNLFRMVKYHPEAVEKELEYMLNSREMFLEMRDADIRRKTEIQRAARYFFLIKVSYGASLTSFGCAPRNVLKIGDLTEVQRRLSGVLIENKSFDKLIRAQDGEGTLFYCDPPYYQAENYYDTGNFVFDKTQHILLRDTLRDINGKFVLSYNDDPFIRELYQDFRIEEVERSNNLGVATGGKKRYRGLIILNY